MKGKKGQAMVASYPGLLTGFFSQSWKKFQQFFPQLQKINCGSYEASNVMIQRWKFLLVGHSDSRLCPPAKATVILVEIGNWNRSEVAVSYPLPPPPDPHSPFH